MVNRHFRPTLKKAGPPRVRFHDLRHTLATLLLQEGVPVTVVSKMLGHIIPPLTPLSDGEVASVRRQAFGKR
jgi:integrase